MKPDEDIGNEEGDALIAGSGQQGFTKRYTVRYSVILCGVLALLCIFFALLISPAIPQFQASPAIRQTTMTNAWVQRLPTFNNVNELAASPKWSSYLKQVYGPELNDIEFPLDLQNFQFFYTDYLDSAGFKDYPQPGSEDVKVLLSPCVGNSVLMEGDVFHGQLDGLAHYIMIYRPSLFRRIDSNSTVEVFHGKCQDGRYEPFYWMYWMPGTGIFYNMGQTDAYQRHAVSVDDAWLREMAATGLDSLNFFHYEEFGIYKFEIIDLRKLVANTTTSYVCPLEPTAFSSKGKQCICDPTVDTKALNCVQ